MNWTPAQVRKTILFVALVGVGCGSFIYGIVTGTPVDMGTGGFTGLIGLAQTLLE